MRTSRTLPFTPIVASTTTTPCTRAARAIAGYAGAASLTFAGGRIAPPGRSGAASTAGGSGAAINPTVTPPSTMPPMPVFKSGSSPAAAAGTGASFVIPSGATTGTDGGASGGDRRGEPLGGGIGGGNGGAPRKLIIAYRGGITTSEAITGTMIAAAMISVCAAIDTSTG